MKLLLAGFIGGLVMCVWSAVAHMNPLTGSMGLSTLNEKKEAVLAAVKSNSLSPGMYFFPGLDMTKHITKEEESSWTAKFKAEPSGVLLIQPPGADPMTPGQLVTQFLFDV